jgi:signal transduction histidine kinase/FixJ family two-component response regulator
MADYKEKIDIFRQMEAPNSIELRVQVAIITFGILTCWLLLDLQWLLYWYSAYVGLIVIEKTAQSQMAGSGKRSHFIVLLALNFCLATVYAILPATIWIIGDDAYQLAATALLVGATLNTFLVRSRMWQVVLCYMIPNAFVFVAILIDMYVSRGLGSDVIGAGIVAICVLGYFAVAIQEANRSHRELIQTRERLAHSQKVEAIGNLTGGVAHDFNNLLNVVSGNLELLRDATDTKDREALIAHALQAVERGAGLTQQMLAFGRRSHLRPQSVEIRVALAELEHMLSRLLPSTVNFVVQCSPKQPFIFVDASAFQTAMITLCINARDAMPRGGDLEITVYEWDRKLRSVRFRSPEASEMIPDLCISVQDKGPGIPDHLIEQVVEPFFSTKPAGAGTGLGLSMVAGFVAQSGGELLIEQPRAGGTRVRMILPQYEASTLAAAKDAARSPAMTHGRDPKTVDVLVVEDEPQLRRLIEVRLEHDGFNVKSAETGDDALQLIGSGYRPDVVISDVVMPGAVQGPDLLTDLSRRFENMHFIVISGYAHRDNDWSKISEEKFTFYQKPVSICALSDAVLRMIGAPQSQDYDPGQTSKFASMHSYSEQTVVAEDLF